MRKRVEVEWEHKLATLRRPLWPFLSLALTPLAFRPLPAGQTGNSGFAKPYPQLSAVRETDSSASAAAPKHIRRCDQANRHIGPSPWVATLWIVHAKCAAHGCSSYRTDRSNFVPVTFCRSDSLAWPDSP